MKIVCLGDSNTWGYDPRGYLGGRYDYPWPELLARKLHCAVSNLGENGRRIPGRAMVFPADTDYLLIMLGTNDLLQGEDPRAVCDQMERFLTSLKMDGRKILLIAPPPMRPGTWVREGRLIGDSASLASCYRTLADRLGIRFADAGQWNIPIAYDGVHLTEDGHALFADALKAYGFIKENSKQEEHP